MVLKFIGLAKELLPFIITIAEMKKDKQKHLTTKEVIAIRIDRLVRK